MIGPDLSAAPRLQIRRIYAAPRAEIFNAWTEPQELRKWFGLAEGFTTPIAQVDLRVGGKYRLGMQPPNSEQILIAEGVYREIVRPERLVFTWRWESPDTGAPYTLVTIELAARGDTTEMILTHEGFANEPERNQHEEGWQGCLKRLEVAIQRR